MKRAPDGLGFQHRHLDLSTLKVLAEMGYIDPQVQGYGGMPHRALPDLDRDISYLKALRERYFRNPQDPYQRYVATEFKKMLNAELDKRPKKL